MNILFIEDHALFREALIYQLKKLSDEVFVHETSTILDARELILNMRSLDMILLDISLPGIDGLTALPDLRELRASVPIVILSESNNIENIKSAKKNGASGFIQKTCNRHELLGGLKTILTKNIDFICIPPIPIIITEPGEGETDDDGKPQKLLTPQEIEVLKLIDKGDSNKIIAFKLNNISVDTVRTHIRNIFQKLNVTNRIQAVVKAKEMRLF